MQNPLRLPTEVEACLAQIPQEATPNLDSCQTEGEIKWAVMALGPTKAPGPDGVSAALIQQNWELFGPIVMKEVNLFFCSGQMKDSVGKSNLVLIPKVQTPKMVSEYRPISVCNFLYKVISKLIAKKMQPWMDVIISQAQTTFIPGREISENIVLLREITHSFKNQKGGPDQFVLKADLAKAFDMIRWEYLFYLLPLYGFPPRLCGWIEACVRSAKFTIQINGSGDGFLTPTRGLRQGCSISPYLFIIAMDPLSRWMDQKMRSKAIRGLKVTRSAPAMACSMFADDLILMGTLTCNEVEAIHATLTNFSMLSGLKINQGKSKAWFSAGATTQSKRHFLRYFGVLEATGEERYLGCPVAVTSDCSFDYLIEKFETRLNIWKARLLTHAGRLILLKAILESLPVYAMGMVILPPKIIAKLTSIMRNFFWGGTNEKRRMAYVAWKEVTTPKGMGGLGLRSLKELNSALVMKMVWKIAQGSNSPWAQVLRAKYYLRSEFWPSTRTYRCTKLWKNIIQTKAVLRNHILWELGSGEGVPVFSEPWFPQWQEFRAQNALQRRITVSSLICQESGTWDFQKLEQFFGFTQALNIATSIPKCCPSSEVPDTLFFTFAKTGKFSIKKAYQLLKGDVGLETDKRFWEGIWKNNGILPKLKLFLWRCVHRALPVRGVIGARIQTVPVTCQLCNCEAETVEHAIFRCGFAKSVWLNSPLNLDTDIMHGSCKEILE